MPPPLRCCEPSENPFRVVRRGFADQEPSEHGLVTASCQQFDEIITTLSLCRPSSVAQWREETRSLEIREQEPKRYVGVRKQPFELALEFGPLVPAGVVTYRGLERDIRHDAFLEDDVLSEHRRILTVRDTPEPPRIPHTTLEDLGPDAHGEVQALIDEPERLRPLEVQTPLGRFS